MRYEVKPHVEVISTEMKTEETTSWTTGEHSLWLHKEQIFAENRTEIHFLVAEGTELLTVQKKDLD